MEHHDKRHISGEYFSAKNFFEQCANGAANPDGRIGFTEELPPRGIFSPVTSRGSLIWIDGIYGDSLALERFFTALCKGEIPAPISGPASRAINQRLRYTSPAALIAAPRTILATCGLVESVVAAAQRAPHSRCSGCNVLLTRYHSPLAALDAITNDQNGKTVSIYAESSDPRITEWAASRGLRIASFSDSHTSVYLDRIQCGAPVNTSVGTLMHSAWRIPTIRFTACESTPDKPLKCYAPAGWCQTCSVITGPILPTKLRELLTYGIRESNLKTPEALIALTPSLTLGDLLTAQVCNLPRTENAPLDRVCELLTTLSLATCSLGTTTDILDACDLAKLSIVATILTSAGPNNQIIIDLPRGIIPHADVSAVQRLLELETPAASVVVLHDIFATGPYPPDDIEIENGSGRELVAISVSRPSTGTRFTHQLRCGELLRIPQSKYTSHKLFHEITEQITATVTSTDAPVIVAPIPVFKSLHKSTSVVGEELGLLEPLAQLYAASLDARAHGLTAKDFTLFRTRSPRHICEHCSGLGVVLTPYETLPRPLAVPCGVCRGTRCKPPISTALFRGVSFSTILNLPISQSAQTLTALSKAKQVLDMVMTLDLHHLPLGMPTALLSTSEVRRLFVARALRQARQSKPAIILFESPNVGLSKLHQERLARIRDTSLADKSATWVEVH